MVRDVDDRHAMTCQFTDDLEQHLHLGRAEGGCRLVHDQDTGIGRQRSSNLDHLLLANPEILDERVRRDVFLKPCHHLFGDLSFLAVVDGAGTGPNFSANEDVVPHAEVRQRSALGG